jgi:hypothetical protein
VARRGEGWCEGLLLQPYPNYLGRDVIGAWRWLREHDIGVASKSRPARPMRR